MSAEISRMYGSREQAENAVAELREEGFDEIFVVSKPEGGASIEEIAGQIAKGFVPMSEARIYAAGVANGGTLVTVHAAFGSGMKATRIMESFETIDSGLPQPAPETYWDEATPMSSALHMPVLLEDAAPFSRFWSITPLADHNFSLSGMFGLPMTSSEPGDSRWGFPFLSGNPTPLSSMLGLPVLKKEQKSW